MAKGHIEAELACLAGMLSKPEPSKAYLALLPSDDWDAARHRGGSANIPLMAAAAFYQFATSAHDRARADLLIRNYAKYCRTQYMLNEPLSWIYGPWIFTAWLAIILTARKRGDTDIEADYTAFCLQFLALCEMQAARGEKQAPYSGTDGKLLPRTIVALCGARSWGHGHTAELGFAQILLAARTGNPPRLYKTDWVSVALNDKAVLARLVALYKMLDKTSLWRTYVKFPMKEDFQFIGHEDGSRICIMGSDEAEDDNENPNGNTPSINFFGVLAGMITQAPGWPNPADGDERIRQVMVYTDIDGSPEEGWTVESSHIGFKRGARFVTEIPAYRGSKLKFWYALYSNGMKETVFPVAKPPVVVPPQPPPKPKREPWWKRWFGGLFG